MMEGRRDPVRPNEFVDVEIPLSPHLLIILNLVSDHQHLVKVRMYDRGGKDGRNLTYIGNFEHLLVVQRLLRLNNTWKVNKFCRIRVIAYVKGCPARV
jgi:hypothetical protein